MDAYRNRLSRNTITLLASNGGSAVLSFVLSVLIGRALGQDGLGIYATALAWVFPLSLLADFGLSTLMTREVAQNVDSDLLRETTLVRLLLGGAFMLTLVLAAPLLSNHSGVVQGIQISAPLVLIAPFFGAFTAIFRAYRIMWPVAWLNLGMLLAQVILTALVFVGGGGVIATLVVNVATSAVQLTAAWAVWRWKFQQTGEARPAPIIGMSIVNILRRAWPFALAGILAAVQLRVSVILLERLSSAGEVGYYAAASRFVEAGRMIPNALFGALFPMLAALAVRPHEMSDTFRRVMIGLAIFAIALGVIISLFAGAIIGLTYGDDFLPAAPVLQIAMWSLLPSLLRGGRTLYWYALEQERFVNGVTAVTLVLQIALGLWLIPIYGAAGAAAVNLAIEGAAFASLIWPQWNNRKGGKENVPAG